jgi:hypothetical protein
MNTRALSLALCLLAAVASAADTWTTPFVGVKRLHRTTSTPWNIHVLVVDLTAPGVSLLSTESAHRRKTPSAWGALVGAQAAVNGDFFSYTTYGTSGLAAGNGVQWTDTQDTASSGNFAFGPGRAEITALAPIVPFDASWMKGVVSGKPQVVTNGVSYQDPPNSSFCTTRHPRTAVGLSQDGKTLYVAVIDGRQTGFSVGMKCSEVGTLMKGLGAHNALNLDGGGSSAMWLSGTGVVNSPSDGNVRVVANHLGIKATASGALGTLKGIITDAASGAKLQNVTVTSGAASDTTDAQGLYVLNLPPGSHTATATFTGYGPASVTRTLTAGATTWGSMALTKSTGPTDLDQDGVPDAQDNCPAVANANQLNTDGDGEGNACDGDDDGDGQFDEDDDCPLEPNPAPQPCPGAVTPDAGSEPTPDAGSEEQVDAGAPDFGFNDAGTPPPMGDPDEGNEVPTPPTVPTSGCSAAPAGLLLPLVLALHGLRRRRAGSRRAA